MTRRNMFRTLLAGPAAAVGVQLAPHVPKASRVVTRYWVPLCNHAKVAGKAMHIPEWALGKSIPPWPK